MDIVTTLYMVSFASSFAMNTYLTEKAHIQAKKTCKRFLKYKKGLNYRTKDILYKMNIDNYLNLGTVFIRSLIPINNVFYTYDCLKYDDELLLSTIMDYEQIIKEANEKEDEVRKRNVDFLKSIKEKLENTEELNSLLNDSHGLSDKEVKKILRLNKLSYDVLMLNYEEDNDIKY